MCVCSIVDRNIQIPMDRKLLYAFRGWIAFVAFMDLGTTFRSYIEKRSFLDDPTDAHFTAGKSDVIFCLLRLNDFFSLIHDTQATTLCRGWSECTAYLRHWRWSTAHFTFTTNRKCFFCLFVCLLSFIHLIHFAELLAWADVHWHWPWFCTYLKHSIFDQSHLLFTLFFLAFWTVSQINRISLISNEK